MTQDEKDKIVDFCNACNDMIEGRFILSDTKVSNILKCVVKSAIIYDLYSKCMKNFKFSTTLQECLVSNSDNDGKFSMPDRDEDVVAFVTCLLLEVDKQNINLQKFVTENFYNPDGYNISYNNFALTVLSRYRDAVINLVGTDDDAADTDSEEEIDEVDSPTNEKAQADHNTKLLFANLLMNITELQNEINNDVRIKYNEKEELLIVLKALARAIKIEELLIINALLVPLEHTIPKYRKLKSIYDEIKLQIADIYY